jgi:hypothetical protein
MKEDRRKKNLRKKWSADENLAERVKRLLKNHSTNKYDLEAGLPDGLCICLPKIPICVYFGGPWNRKCWHILRSFGIFYGHWVYIITICFISWPFRIFLPVWVFCTKKNLATLFGRGTRFILLVHFKRMELDHLFSLKNFFYPFSSTRCWIQI